ncbi:hypothetical protein SAMN04487944_1175 [Gracilibacillus ureilyticus]|uniref:Uncharacterized protein n=1 Tax=Gracilibacillus ureilyticus TaxID=531814 RepID=A0A1H9UC35_9BACI|nr:hypothetical protein [Gracilibacillus ureilyticus]SES06919.1 hypothetical protein SAMN04487944_1175 [Gracilibacillus ureilyticus]
MALVTHYGVLNWTKSNKVYYESLGYKYTNLGDCFEVAAQHLSVDQPRYPKHYTTKWIGKKQYNDHYKERGYIFTKPNEKFLVSPCDLLPNSKVEILCICDSCNIVFECGYYLHYQRRTSNKSDTCDNCTQNKEVNFINYLNKLKKAYLEGMFVIKDNTVSVKTESGYVVMHSNRKNQIYLPLFNKSRISKGILLFIPNPENNIVSEENLAIYWYENKLPNVKLNGFWTISQCKACLLLVKSKGESLSTLNLRKKYNNLYTAITKQMPYYDFLLYCGEDPIESYFDEFETIEDRRLLGIYVEHNIRNLITKHSNYFDFQQKDQNNRLDIINKIDKSVTEFKLSIDMRLNKEKRKYVEYNLSIVFLLGEEYFFDITKEGFKVMSIFQWIDLNKKYLKNTDLLIDKIRRFKNLLLDPVTASKESQNYYTNLCKKIFELSRKGESHESIAEKLGPSRRQIGRILNGQTLKPYIDKDLSLDYKIMKREEKDIRSERNRLIVELSNSGRKTVEIQMHISKIYGSISINRIEQIIHKSNIKKVTKKGEIVATDMDGNVLGVFSTSTEAAKELDLPNYRNICTVLRNERPHYKKIKFSYA